MLSAGQTIQALHRELVKEIGRTYDPAESRSLARLVLEHLGYPEQTLLQDPRHVPAEPLVDQINKITALIHKNQPIQYILGETEFYGIPLKVNRHVLIPRQETELLAEHVILSGARRHPQIVEIGTGSGCLALALKKHIPHARILATDLSAKALETARRNAEMHRMEIAFVQHHILGEAPLPLDGPVNILVSNPPYVRQRERTQMHPNVTDHEPASALFVPDHDPLRFYRAIAAFASRQLHPHGTVWVEINEALGRETEEVFHAYGFTQTSRIRDLQNKDRIIKAERDHG